MTQCQNNPHCAGSANPTSHGHSHKQEGEERHPRVTPDSEPFTPTLQSGSKLREWCWGWRGKGGWENLGSKPLDVVGKGADWVGFPGIQFGDWLYGKSIHQELGGAVRKQIKVDTQTLRCLWNMCTETWEHRYESESCSGVPDSVTPWTVAHWAPLSMGFSRQEYWRGLPFSFPKDLPNQGLKLGLLHCRQTLYHLSHQGKGRNILYNKATPRLSSQVSTWGRKHTHFHTGRRAPQDGPASSQKVTDPTPAFPQGASAWLFLRLRSWWCC